MILFFSSSTLRIRQNYRSSRVTRLPRRTARGSKSETRGLRELSRLCQAIVSDTRHLPLGRMRLATPAAHRSRAGTSSRNAQMYVGVLTPHASTNDFNALLYSLRYQSSQTTPLPFTELTSSELRPSRGPSDHHDFPYAVHPPTWRFSGG